MTMKMTMPCRKGLLDNYSRETKIGLFYGICLPLRICLGLAVWFLAQKYSRVISILTLLLSIIAMILTGKGSMDQSCVWWNRRVHFFSSMCLFVVSILSLTNIIEAKYIALVIWIDLLWGFVDSLFHFV